MILNESSYFFLVVFLFYLVFSEKSYRKQKKLDILELIKYNFPMHYENVTKEIKDDIIKMQGK